MKCKRKEYWKHEQNASTLSVAVRRLGTPRFGLSQWTPAFSETISLPSIPAMIQAFRIFYNQLKKAIQVQSSMTNIKYTLVTVQSREAPYWAILRVDLKTFYSGNRSCITSSLLSTCKPSHTLGVTYKVDFIPDLYIYNTPLFLVIFNRTYIIYIASQKSTCKSIFSIELGLLVDELLSRVLSRPTNPNAFKPKYWH